jgi:hypothetical protein
MTDGMEFDHNPPLVQHYYEGVDGGLPGFNQTPAERRAFATSLSHGGPATPAAQRLQGLEMMRYSIAMKKMFGL